MMPMKALFDCDIDASWSHIWQISDYLKENKKWAQSVSSATKFKLLDFYQGQSIAFSMVFWLEIHIEYNWRWVRYLTK